MINRSLILDIPHHIHHLYSTSTASAEDSTTTLPYWATAIDPDSNDDVCSPYRFTNNSQEVCDYVKYFKDACESGGYLLWTEIVVCTESYPIRVILIIASIIYLFFLFLMMTTTADDFFCLSISTIVDHLKISQSLAGITLMAFGNGAPDIFSTIASVLNTSKPKAGLAFGDLMGGGAFVTTIVFATVIITKPFKAAKWATIRDLGFYIVGIAWMAFIMLYDKKLYIWQPAAYLAIYLIYVLIVIAGRFYEKFKRKKQRYHKRMERAMSNFSQISELKPDNLPQNGHCNGGEALHPPRQSLSLHDSYPQENGIEHHEDQEKEEEEGEENAKEDRTQSLSNTSKFNSPINVIMEPMRTARNSHAFVIPNIVISPSNPLDGMQSRFKYHNGKFHFSEKDFDSESDDASDVVVIPATHTGRRFTIMSLNDARMSVQTDHIPHVAPDAPITAKRIMKDLLAALNPVEEDFKDSKWYSKILQAMKFPLIVVLRLTVPQAIVWCKTLSLIHCLTMPITVLFSFNLLGKNFWLYSFIPAIIMFLIVFFFTSYNIEPHYHKNISGYFGFLISVSWIYVISSEVVNVITMISVISKLSHEILGLTVMAWCNSIGDLVADISVAKQGFPQMAASAAIGGPLFNLLVGFGAAFFIAILQGKDVDISIDTVKGLLLASVAASLIATFVILIINKFHATRIHGVILIILYVVLLIGVILADLKVFTI